MLRVVGCRCCSLFVVVGFFSVDVIGGRCVIWLVVVCCIGVV